MGAVKDDLLGLLTGGQETLAPNADLRAVAAKAATSAGIDPDFYVSLIDKGEGGFANPGGVSKKGARGPAQLMPDTAKELGVENVDDPSQNLAGGAKYLKSLLDRYHGNRRLAAAAYNAGPDAVDKAGGVPDYPETQAYVGRVLGTPNTDLGAVLGGAADDKSDKAYAEAFGGAAGQPAVPATIKAANGKLLYGDTGAAIPDAQANTIRTLDKGGLLDPNGEPGAARFPWVQRNPEDTFKPGEYFVDTTGSLKRVPGGDKSGAAPSIAEGLQQGVSDIELTGARLLPGSEQFGMRPALEANQLVYNANHEGDSFAQGGRFAGQLATTLPLGGVVGKGAGLAGGALVRAAPVAAPVLDFLAGKAAGNILVRGGSLAARGAGEGAVQGGLMSGANPNESLGNQIAHGAEAGAVLNPLLPGIGAVGKGAARMLEPFTETGRNKLIDRFLVERAAGGPTTPDLKAYVPGSNPTLAQATANPGLATLERGVKAINPSPFESLAASNQQARELALDAAKGDRQSLDDLIAARAAQTDPMRQAAFANTTQVDPKPVVDAIDQVLASPSGQRDAVVSALHNVREKLVKDDGTLQSDPEQLWGIRQAIGDMLSPLSAGTKSDGRLASRELMTIKDALDPVIEKGAPGFKGYLDAYSKASDAVDAQDFLQGLKWTDSRGSLTLGRVDSAIDRIEKARSKGGSNPAKGIPDATMQAIFALRDDLRRQANSDLGRGSGSDTVQKLATNQLVDTLAVPAAVGLGLHGPLGAAALGIGKLAYGAKNRALMDSLAEKLVNAPMGASAFQPPSARNKLLDYGQRALVPVGVAGANNLLLPH
jgi:hypothetical protein